MKLLTRWTIVAAVLAAPYALVMLAGWWWLYEQGYFVWWAVAAGVLLFAGQWLVEWSQRGRPSAPSGIGPSPDWAPAAEPAWKKVEELSARVRLENWPLDDPERWWELLRRVLDTIAREYHARSDNPVLEVPVPHLMKVVELVARDLGEASAEKIPGSHLLTVNDLRRLTGLAQSSNKAYNVYYNILRWARICINPISGFVREIADQLSGNLIDRTTGDVKGWALDFAVRKAGFYAIELYSGRLVLDDEALRTYVTKQSARDLARAGGSTPADKSREAEPLRMLVLGQVNAGKSSLINALFGDVRTAVDALPTTRGVKPFVYQRQGTPRALIFDTAGYGEAARDVDPFEPLADELLRTDLVLLVCSATTAARQPDRRVLDRLRERFAAQRDRKLPPVIVALTHIDLLRPFAEWAPPYDLSQTVAGKARSVAEATAAVSEELQLPVQQVVPVCLHPERLYNVEEALLPAMMEWLPEAARARALRCLGSYQDEESWRRLWRQTLGAGRLLKQGAAEALRRG